MKRLAQSRPIAVAFFCVAFSALLIFRGFIRQFFSIFINVMAFIAFLNLGGFIVIIMPKNGRRPPLNLKTIPRHHHHILLTKSRQSKDNRD